jgi:hypothetical protein
MPNNRHFSVDQRLVARCLHGETASWAELQQCQWPPLFNYLQKRLHNWPNADWLVWEIADDVWLSLSYPDYRRLRAFNCRRGSLERFLRALADDRVRQARRKLGQRKESPHEPLPVDLPGPPDIEVETRELLERFAATLPPQYLAFFRHELLGVPPPEGWQRPSEENCRVLKHRIYLLYKDFCKSPRRGGGEITWRLFVTNWHRRAVLVCQGGVLPFPQCFGGSPMMPEAPRVVPPAPRGAGWGVLFVRVALGALLLTAAGLKAHGLMVDPFSEDSFFSSPRLHLATIELEVLLALWLFSGWAMGTAWLIAFAFFASSGSISLYLALDGQSSCGCFGRIAVNPWWTFFLDMTAMAGLVAWRPARVSEIVAGTAKLRGGMSTALGAAVMLVLIAGGFQLSFDTPAAALAELRGEPITVEPVNSWVGKAVADDQSTLTIQLTNHGNGPVQVFGGSANCACVATDDLPISIPSGQSRPVSVRVFFRGKPGRFHGGFVLFTDNMSQPVVRARFSGRVIESPSS